MFLLNTKDWYIVLIATSVVLVASVIGWLVIGSAVLVVDFTITLLLVLILHVETFRRLQNNYSQVEALFSLFSSLSITYPLPAMRVFAASPDFAKVIVSVVRAHRPQIIVEAGSGVSTLIAAYALARNGSGELWSLDHDAGYAARSAATIADHELQGIAHVLHAPLIPFSIQGTTWLWYDLTGLASIQRIDMLIVDGPPGAVQKLARYPALPLLFDRLSSAAIIVMDDTLRPDESAVMRRWLSEFGDFTAQTFPAEKGAVVLRRRTPALGGAASSG